MSVPSCTLGNCLAVLDAGRIALGVDHMHHLAEWKLFEGDDEVSSLREYNILEEKLMFEGGTYYTCVLILIYCKSVELI